MQIWIWPGFLSVTSQLPPRTSIYWLTPLANLSKFAPTPVPKRCPGRRCATWWVSAILDLAVDNLNACTWCTMLKVTAKTMWPRQRSKRVQVIPVPGDLKWRYHKTIISIRTVFPVPYIYCCCMRDDIVRWYHHENGTICTSLSYTRLCPACFFKHSPEEMYTKSAAYSHLKPSQSAWNNVRHHQNQKVSHNNIPGSTMSKVK